MKYYTIVTEIGTNAITQAAIQGKKVNITHFAVGDGDGNYYKPDITMTTLKREKWRGEVSKYEIDKFSPNIIKVSAIIPQNLGDFTMREMGLFDNKNNLIAVCNTPDLVKAILEDGISTEVEVSMRIAVANTEVIQFNIDPSLIMATKKDIENAIDIHSINENAHKNLFDSKVNKDLSNITQQTIINKINSTENGNGLNADKLDGKHANNFVQYLGNLSEEIFTNPSYAINYEGVLQGLNTTISGLPNNGWYKIKYIKHTSSDGYGTQIAIPESTNKYRKILYREASGSTWGIWQNISDGGNADTIDGKHASDLQNYNNLTNKPTSLPANGGNADTVDGKHASDFLGNTNFLYQYHRNSNIDDIKTEYHCFVFNCTGTPTTNEYGFLDVSKFDGSLFSPSSGKTVIRQIFTRWSNRQMFIRIYREDNNTWTDWKNVGDDGNADTVDGKHASDLQNYNNLTNKPTSLPANGGNADTVDNKHASDLQNYNNLTNKPTSLPANGGNADTVDGKHANNFVQYLGNLSEEIFTNPSYAINYEGVLQGLNTTISGLPNNGWYKIKYIKHISSDGYGTQIAIPESTNKYRKILYREASGTTWGIWQNISDGGNAMTLEGYSVSALLDYFKEGFSVIKSIQRGVASSSSITISEIDPSKSFVILNTTDTVTTAVSAGSTSRLGCYLNSLSATKLNITTSGSHTSWQVIEFN